jgi:thiol-disulfide isomerase/thioredoxin
MKTMNTRLLAGLLLLLTMNSPALAGEASPALDTLGDHVDLAELDGKVVYVDFWASWCAPCQKSFPWMAEIQERHGDEGLVILAVNVDRTDKPAEKFLEGRNIPFRILRDPKGEVASAFDVKAMPTAFVFTRDGDFAWKHEGFRESESSEVEQRIVELLGTEKGGAR